MLYEFFDEIVNGSATKRVVFWLVFALLWVILAISLGSYINLYGETIEVKIARFFLWFTLGGVTYNYYLAHVRKNKRK